MRLRRTAMNKPENIGVDAHELTSPRPKQLLVLFDDERIEWIPRHDFLRLLANIVGNPA